MYPLRDGALSGPLSTNIMNHSELPNAAVTSHFRHITWPTGKRTLKVSKIHCYNEIAKSPISPSSSRDVQWCRVLSVIHFEIQSNYDSSLTNVVKLLLPALYPLTLCVLSRDYHLSPTPLVRVSMYGRVTLAVRVLSRDYHLSPTPLVRVSMYARVTLAVRVLSRDYHLPPTPLVRVSMYARVTRAVHVLSRDYHLSPTPLVTVSMYARVTLAVHVLSRDYHSTLQLNA